MGIHQEEGLRTILITMNAHNRVYPPYTFESSDEEEFPASVHEMAERSESIPHVLDVDNGFAM